MYGKEEKKGVTVNQAERAEAGGKKSILKVTGSSSKPKSKISWGNLSLKVQLPSPDDSQRNSGTKSSI